MNPKPEEGEKKIPVFATIFLILFVMGLGALSLLGVWWIMRGG